MGSFHSTASTYPPAGVQNLKQTDPPLCRSEGGAGQITKSLSSTGFFLLFCFSIGHSTSSTLANNATGCCNSGFHLGKVGVGCGVVGGQDGNEEMGQWYTVNLQNYSSIAATLRLACSNFSYS